MDGLRASIILLIIILIAGALVGWVANHHFQGETPKNGLLERETSLNYADRHSIIAVSPVYFPRVQILALAERIIHCESRGIHDVWGDLNYKYPAYGKWQFQERTFYWMADLAGYKGLDWKNEHHQDLVGMWALRNGYENHWTCYHIVNK